LPVGSSARISLGRETTANLTRNITLTVASILTVFVSLAIVGTTVLVRQGAANMNRRFEGGIEFIVYVNADASTAEVDAVRKDLEANPNVADAIYVDRDATFKEFRRLFKGNSSMLDNVRPADLPTSFRVKPTDRNAEFVQQLVNYYRKRPNVFAVTAAIEVLREMKGITTFINSGLTVFAGFLLVASALLILNTIRTAMFARRREIEVMKLVGATNWFIRIPFILEGLVQGLVGGVLAVGSVFLARGWLDRLQSRAGSLKLLDQFSVESGDVILASTIVLLIAVFLSTVSSAVATRRFLDV
jgi:cell division transport system permease protein